MKGQGYAVISGLLAALASLFGKYAISAQEALDLCDLCFKTWTGHYFTENCREFLIIIRGLSFMFMFMLNCVMWVTFTKALRFCPTSIEATIINTASNFFFTAIVGQVLLGEVVSGLWWTGIVFILCGLLVIHHSKNASLKKSGTRKKIR